VINHDEPVFDPLAMVRRRFWSILIPPIAGAIVGLGLVLWLPREYVASATLAVTTPSVSRDLTKATPQDLSDRTRAISQELLSVPVVEQVAREEGLLKEGADADAVIAGIRARTQVSLPTKTLGPGRDEPDTFVVSYTGATAHEAQRVTNRLLNVFIERDSNLRQTRAKDTAAFISEQLRDSERRMDEAEAALRKAKETHSGLLPEQAIANMQAMSDLRQRVSSNADALRAERDRLAQVEQQLDQARREASADTRSEEEIKAADRVAALERQLANAHQLYTPAHPEIQRLQADLQLARADEKAARASASAAGVRPLQKAEQTVAQLAAERERLRARIRDLQVLDSRLPAEIASYQARVNQAPIIEQQLAPLEQAYEVEKAQHQRLAERYQAALIAENLETRRAGGQFAVLSPAGLPSMPSRPNVPRVFAFSVFVGAILGAALAFLREYLDKTVHDARTLQHEYDQVVLAEIPHLRRKRA
jgi:polysaccharide chain length determinant protein (PEP-CTERM system associated)